MRADEEPSGSVRFNELNVVASIPAVLMPRATASHNEVLHNCDEDSKFSVTRAMRSAEKR